MAMNRLASWFKRQRKGKRGGKSTPPWRRRLRWLTLMAVLGLAAYALLGVWYVHHPPKWLAETEAEWPRFVTAALAAIGNPLGEATDALALTGHDVVYEYDEEAPHGSTIFAGEPRRVGEAAPRDLQVLKRGDFIVGWSPSLRHAVWCAYHVTPEPKYEYGERPHFRKDPSAARCPAAGDYSRSGYDRGHLAPNHAIASRYGETAQRATFMMSNVAPQSPALNRGVWREIEHRIADLWTKRYGEIWVVVGCISPLRKGGETLSGTDIDVPEKFYQLIVAQEGLDIRAMALVFDQTVGYGEWPTRHLVTIDELEELTGFDFLPELPDFIQSPLEAELPTRLWPIAASDIFRFLAIHYGN